MEQDSEKFEWNKKREDAAYLVANDEISDEAIAEQLKIGRTTLFRWKKHPVFAARVNEIVGIQRQVILSRGIADKVKRVEQQNDRWKRMRRVINERAAEYEGKKIAGGESGLLVRTFKIVGTGPGAYEVEEFAVDTGLLRELREIEKQAAQEVGDWTEKHEHKVDDASLSDEQRVTRIAALLERARARRDGSADSE